MQRKGLFLFIIFFSFIHLVSAQQVRGYLEVKGSIKLESTDQSNSKVLVIVDGVVEKTYPADASGKFTINIDLNKTYTLEIAKQGYYSKRLEFNTSVPAEDVGIWAYKFSIELIPEIQGFDASLLNEPVGKIKFVESVGDFDYDEAYTLAMQKRIKTMMEEYERKRKEAYNATINQADAAFNQANYDEAIELYNKAIDLDPYDPYPDDRLEMIDRIITKDQNNEKNYQKNIALADAAFNQVDYPNAQLYYNRALNYKKDPYPQDQLNKIQQILNNQNADAAALAAKEKAYKEAIAAADRNYTAKEYEKSLAKYQEASGIKPTEQYPKDKITELTKLIAELKNALAGKEAIEKAYREAITLADNQFNQKDYINARTQYQKAKEIKPAEPYPSTRINEIDNILAASKSTEEKYKGYIAVADKSLTEKQYESAKSNYQQASSIKPGEAYPKQKIAEIDVILAQLAQQKQKDLEAGYQKAIAQADASFNKKDYALAKDAYNQALTFKPTEAYPKQKIAEVEKLLAEIAAKKHNYDLAISRADNAFNESKFDVAKVDYQLALSLFPTEPYPQTRLNEIENRLLAQKNAADQQKARDKAYTLAINKGDSLFRLKSYPESKNSFSQALSIKNNEAYPKQKITEIDNLMAQQKMLDEKYAGFISAADQQFIANKYDEARANYVSASQIKQAEAYPKQKIAEIDKLVSDAKAAKEKQQQIDGQYGQLISQADVQFNAKTYDQAKGLYQQASAIKPTEAYPKQKIVEIDNLLGKMASDNQKYQQAITAADGLFTQKKYTEALAQYNQASLIKPDEAYPKQKITEINTLLAQQKQLDGQYNTLITTADQLFQGLKYDEAKANYTSASQLKPAETYPKQKIAEIDRLLADAKSAKEKQQQIDAQYSQLISQADAQFNAKTYDQAKGLYQQASVLKSAETYPKQKIVEIDNLLGKLASDNQKYQQAITSADGYFNQKKYVEAIAAYNQATTIKPAEIYPKNKITEINALLEAQKKADNDYDNYIMLADAAFAQKQYDNAKGQYQAALTVKPAQPYPTQRIAEIDRLLEEQRKSMAEKERIEAQYKSLITSADLLFSQSKYAESKTSYTQASALKPDVLYPKEKIAEIDRLLAGIADKQKAFDAKMQEAANLLNQKNYAAALASYQQASQIKPEEQAPKQKITEIQAIIAENNKKLQQFNGLIAQADNLFNQKNYAGAKPVYQQALAVKSDEKYPADQITRCDQLLADAARLQAEAANKLKAYQSKITEADKLMTDKKYDLAISAYMDAKTIKTDETYPDQQIAKINQLIKDDQQRVDLAYNEALRKGDELVAAKTYEQAKIQYTQAQNLKPKEPLPQKKLIELENLIAQDNAARGRQAKIDQDYNNFITQADNAVKAKDYTSALALYKSAKGVKPDEKYPPQQIEMCERKIQELKALAAAEEEKRKKDELAAAQSSFDKKDFDYSGEQRDNKFLNELAKQYPEGITVENYEKTNKKIKRVIVNNNGIAKEYIEVTYSYGTYYFRNGQNVSRSVFYNETK